MKQAKGIAIILVVLFMLCIASLNLSLHSKVKGSAWTILKIEPLSISANPGQTFTIDINIENVTDLWSYDVKLTWNSALFNVSKTMEGPFMQSFGSTTFQKTITPGVLEIGCLFTGPDTASGSGTLANVTFAVASTGNCSITFNEVTKLKDLNLNLIPYTSEDGYFYTTEPFVSFTASPAKILTLQFNLWGTDVGEITFNGTESYDPDGGSIASYYWDFGDGTNTTATEKTITHIYTQCRKTPYRVNLTVTDNEGEKWSQWIDLLLWHDIVVTYIETATSKTFVEPISNFSRGQAMWIRVHVKNDGSITETFNVTVYLDSVEINSTRVELEPNQYLPARSLQYMVNTSTLESGIHTIKAEAEIVPRETETANNEYSFNVTIMGYITLSPYSGFACTTVTGLYFTPDSTVTITWDGQQIPTVPSKVVTDANGTFTAIITVPTQTSVGGHEVKAADTGGITGTATFSVIDMKGPRGSTGATGPQGISGLSPPIASFTIEPSPPYYAPFTLTFNASASLPGFNGTHNVPIANYTWDFGDGNLTTLTTPIITHAYANNGTYIVTLKTTDSEGLWNTKSITIMTGPHKGDPGSDAPTVYVVTSLGLSIIAICIAAYAAYSIARKKSTE